MNTFREKVTGVIDKVKSSKKLRLLAIMLLIAAIPLTVFIAQQAQDVRQRANTNQATITVAPNTVVAGSNITINWTIAQPTTAAPTPAQCSPRPNVTRVSAVDSPGKIRVTITVDNNAGRTDNVIKSFVLTSLSNISVTIGNQTYTTPTTVDIPDAASTSIVINQVTPGQAATLGYQIVDACGPFNDTQGGGAAGWNTTTAPTPTNTPVPATPTNTQVPTNTPVPPTATPVPVTATISMSPQSVPRGTPIVLRWQYTSGSPSVTDLFEVFTASGIHAQWLYASSCGQTPGATPPPTSGSCSTIPTQNYGPATYTVKFYRNANPASVLAATSFTISYHLPSLNLIKPAFAQTLITGGETMQLFKSGTNEPTGRLVYLNCLEKGVNVTPPATPQYTGTCQYPLSPQLASGSYIIRMFATDGTTEIGESIPFTVQSVPTISPSPSVSPSISPTPINPMQSATFSATLFLTGLGSPSGTFAPKHPERLVLVTLMDKNNATVAIRQGTIQYNQLTGNFTGTVSMGDLCPPNAPCRTYGLDDTAQTVIQDQRRPLPTGNPPYTQNSMSCTTDADCPRTTAPPSLQCFKHENYQGTCKPTDTVCAQVVTKACHPRSTCNADGNACTNVEGMECVDFPNPCVVPPGWVKEGDSGGVACPLALQFCQNGETLTTTDIQNGCPVFKCGPPRKFPEGSYTVKVWTPQFLRKQLPGIISIQSNDTVTLPNVTVTTGDINNDNKINILDYNIITSCFGNKIESAACKTTPQFADGQVPASPLAPLADLNDDGVVDGIDYNLFIRSLSTKEGD